MTEAKQKKEEVIWDKKKIIIFIISAALLLLLVLEIKTLILGKSQSIIPARHENSKKVEGASNENLPDLGQNLRNQLNSIKTEAQNINVVDIATSSPQVQKVINDLKSLENLPQSQIKQACEKICNGL